MHHRRGKTLQRGRRFAVVSIGHLKHVRGLPYWIYILPYGRTVSYYRQFTSLQGSPNRKSKIYAVYMHLLLHSVSLQDFNLRCFLFDFESWSLPVFMYTIHSDREYLNWTYAVCSVVVIVCIVVAHSNVTVGFYGDARAKVGVQIECEY